MTYYTKPVLTVILSIMCNYDTDTKHFFLSADIHIIRYYRNARDATPAFGPMRFA